MPYKITIERIIETIITERGKHEVLDHRPWTDDELAKTSGYYPGGPTGFLKDNPLHPISGYAPDRQVQTTETETVFEQTVESLNLKSVINAINATPRKSRTPKVKP